MAERSLLGAYSQGKALVGKSQVVAAQAEVFGTSLSNKGTKPIWGWLSFALLLLTVAIFLLDMQPWLDKAGDPDDGQVAAVLNEAPSSTSSNSTNNDAVPDSLLIDETLELEENSGREIVSSLQNDLLEVPQSLTVNSQQ